MKLNNRDIQEWEKLEEVMKEASLKVLGERKEKRRQTWFDEECKTALKDRNMLRKQLLVNQTYELKEEYRKK